MKGLLLLVTASVIGAASIGPAFANGAGENTPWQFRTPSERQVLLNEEMERLSLDKGLGVGSSSGLGTQTGNAISVTVSGSNNTVTLDTTNSGDQSISDDMLNN